jgi:two-component system phosphate regulon sensor histidine kinase PhoR
MIAEAFERAQDGETQTHVQVEGIRKNSSTFDIDMSFAQVPVDKNHIVVNCHDITNLKEMERIKDNFISMVTHELRTPITAILLIARQLYQYHARMTQEQFTNKIERLFTQSKVMAELIESVLDISRLKGQRELFATQNVQMYRVIEGIVSELSPAAEEQQQIISMTLDPKPISVKGDSIDFDRIWRNLISNAIKYTPNGGSIKINLGTFSAKDNRITKVSDTLLELPWFSEAAFNEELYCVGQVEDTGYGICSEDLPQLFERFHRGWAKQSNIPGTGLGLALVKELLTLYQGDIHVDSEQSVGTIFTFWIPITKGA